jgi:predicted dehydrogenase
MDGIKIIAVADASKAALARASSLGVDKLYRDFRDLFNHPHNIDAVIISLPNFLHFESIRLALESGLHVFTEKPMACSMKESKEIARLAQKSGTKLMVGHCFRFLEALKTLKRVEQEGRIGNLEVITLEEVINGPFSHGATPKPVAEWWFDPKKSGGGVLLDLGYHMIDLFRYFAGESELEFASLDHRLNLQVEDSAILLLRSRNGVARGIINVGWFQQTIFPKYNFRVILHGDAGYLSTEDFVPKNMYLHAIKEGSKNLLRKIVGEKIRPLSYTYFYEMYFEELRHFLDSIKHDFAPCVSAVDALKTMEIIEKTYASVSKTSPLV